MEQSLITLQLAAYTAAQMNTFFLDDHPVRVPELALMLPGVLARLETCFLGLRRAHFHREGVPRFDHLNGDQYSMCLCLLGNEAHRGGNRDIAVKSYHYGNGLLVAQGRTVGNKGGKYPTLGEKVVLLANSSVLGDCRIGSRVCVGAGSQMIEETVPDGATVVGSTPNARILPKQWALLEGYFAEILPTEAEGAAR